MNLPGQQSTAHEHLLEELENYFGNTIIPQLFIDADLILRKFTPSAMKQFDLSTNDIGRPIGEVTQNIRFPSLLANINEVMRTGKGLEKEVQTNDEHWYQMNIMPFVVRSTKAVNGVIITFVEITRRIKDLQELEKLIADNEMLLDAIAHDIKNPLTNILIGVEQLKDVPPLNFAMVKRLAEVLDRSVQQIRQVVNDLAENRRRDFALKQNEELINIEHIIEDVQLGLLEQISQTNAVINSDVKASEIRFVRRKLRSIVYNLISNAIKYRSPGSSPVITVSTWTGDERFMLSVKDNGIGIRPELQESVFSKYVRLNYSVEGTGVGLHLVRQMTEERGGSIELHSVPDQGSEFILSFPDAPPPF